MKLCFLIKDAHNFPKANIWERKSMLIFLMAILRAKDKIMLFKVVFQGQTLGAQINAVRDQTKDK